MPSAQVQTSFWNKKKVFLTGHTGFKGGWLTLWLSHMGADVTGFALKPATVPSIFDALSIERIIKKSIIADIRDKRALTEAISLAQPDVVIHMAAQPLVRYSYANPVETYETNIMGTVHLLDALRHVGSVKAAVIVTTDKCYENQERLKGYTEEEPMGGYDPYSSSKGCAELIVSAYQRSYFDIDAYSNHGLAIATARAGNVIGGGDWSPDRLIPDAVSAFQANEPLIVRHPGAVRPWQHVIEPLSGYLILAQSLFTKGPQYNGGWNFGPDDNDAKAVSGVIDLFAKTWGGNARWEYDGSKQPHEAHFLKLDCTKSMQQLNWCPRWPLEIALKATAKWYQAFEQRQNMQELTLLQIADHQLSQ